MQSRARAAEEERDALLLKLAALIDKEDNLAMVRPVPCAAPLPVTAGGGVL